MPNILDMLNGLFSWRGNKQTAKPKPKFTKMKKSQPKGGAYYVSYPNYSVSVSNGVHLPLGHAMVVITDGHRTRGSEYGRYKSNSGNALRVRVPDYPFNDYSQEHLNAYAKMLYNAYPVSTKGNKINIKFIPFKGDRNYDTVSLELNRYERNSPMKYNWLKGVTCGSYAHNIATGDPVTDMELGGPGLSLFNTTPWSGTSATYEKTH